MFWTIVTWIVLGALAGWIASIITGTDARVNGFMNVVVGIIGAFIGGLVLQLLGASTPSGFNLASLLTAILGAVILLSLVRAFRREPL
ncbi:MAG TPA: GlsB/YeaQ/YmgE family stress response membrane protein [Candidatus Saccharimonadia bacterium]|nr:GlsB/YeaQ/YmgE family stress response membrane protein [Candidatus Saccharimonadia bacterium]